MLAVHPYAGAQVALATRHGKQRALAAALARIPGMRLVLAHDVDTDRLGTFTGEIPRTGSAAETAVRKARLAIESTGLGLAVASEGSFGPHPVAPMLSAGQEILAFLDIARDVCVLERRTTPTNFSHTTTRRIDEATDAFLARVGFGGHAVIVRPHTPADARAPGPIRKGIQTRADLDAAISECAAHSTDGLARLETDMRAHVNPTRMREISVLAHQLASRLATLCSACGTPGYGPVDREPGLPCGTCGEPTSLTLATIHGCAHCPHRSRHPRDDCQRRADPTFCECCNP
ncbi:MULTISPECIES: DUF6671 family protein [Pseudonocardia]|uniref:DUF6671 domain-containing protein n=2 Tax=Pseudonocardia TaxID=1847 RepID=A0A1Y2MGP0_PSEAH|nr:MULTISPECIES: DUF6671 family protein [Pseudonocardia]OSY34454.1 hypothetical protein BG845_06843 [Pseudonocardia autotrophica]OZM75473.1 hypothetical protein CFP66_46135 [Pseudonocardia sp. MH-G8]TDN77199.1 hypothetical protein C8E95_6433 [Pseudonocardia autotrophica]BBG01214.1 hypothetical protein Pdca_24230 [Pseudonocardia autotrophica]GEC29703.1 hypothetical protein PSA01_67320 [Pseudonocardia saturnea]